MDFTKLTSMEATAHSYTDQFAAWRFQGISEEQISQLLQKQGVHEVAIDEILTLYKKKNREERSQKGFFLMVLGAVLGFLSCLMTLLGVLPEYRELIMVGLTTLAICIAVWGCYYVFE